MLAKTISLKVTQVVIFSINTYEQYMIAVGNKNKNLKTNTYGIIFIICRCYHCWGQIIIYPYFIWINVLFGLMKKNVVMSLRFGYMINPGLNVKKFFKEKVEKCMYTTFGAITQPFIKSTLEKIIHVC